MRVFLFIILCVQILGINANCNAQNLNKYLEIAAKSNPLLRAKFAEFESAMQKVTQVSSLPDPMISFGYFISPVETRVGPQQAKIGLHQIFPWFGTLKTAEDLYALQAEIKYTEFIDARNRLYLDVKSAWYPIYEIRQKVRLQKEIKMLLISYKRLTTTKFKHDESRMVDLIRLEVMLGNIDTEIKILEDKLEPLYIGFNRLLNTSNTLVPETEKELELIQVPYGYRRDSLLINNPILEELDLKIASAKERELLSVKRGKPQIGLGIDYVFVGERTDVSVPSNGQNIIMPMVSMSVPIYRKKYNAAIREAQLNQQSIQYSKEHKENMLVASYQMSNYRLNRAMQRVQLYDTQISRLEQAIALLEVSYSNSGQDFEEILTMQQELLKYKMSTASEVASFYLALAELDYITSKAE